MALKVKLVINLARLVNTRRNQGFSGAGYDPAVGGATDHVTMLVFLQNSLTS